MFKTVPLASITFDLIRDEDDVGQVELREMEDAQATREFVVTLPSSTLNVFTFDGFVTQKNHVISLAKYRNPIG